MTMDLKLPYANKSSQVNTGRWGRFVSRLQARALWHIRGVLLWLLQRPGLRYVPMPYPSVASPSQWKLQAEGMVKNKCLPLRHHHMALGLEHYTMKNLADGIFLRNRMGLSLAFLEDPLLAGMLAAKGVRGISSRVKAQAQIEAKENAKKLEAEGKQLEAARALLGPRGGLPTLRRDLLQLAALVHVEVGEKDTVEMIKQKIRPVVQSIMVGSSGSSSKDKVEKSAAKAASSQRPQVMDIATPVEMEAASMVVQSNAVTPEAVAEMLSQQDVKFQAMMSQVMQMVMTMQENQMTGPQGLVEAMEIGSESSHVGQTPPTESEQYTRDELSRLNSEYYQEQRRLRMEMAGVLDNPMVMVADQETWEKAYAEAAARK